MRRMAVLLLLLFFIPSLVHGADVEPPPLGKIDLLCLFDSETYETRVTNVLATRGIDFVPDSTYLQMLSNAGASEEFVKAIKNAQVKTPRESSPSVPAGSPVRETEILEHIARAASIRYHKARPASAEFELRAALQLDPQNAFIILDLGTLLSYLKQNDGAFSAFRYAARLNPDLAEARLWLASMLQAKGNLDEAESECRTVIRVEPQSAWAHNQLAEILEKKGDEKGAAETKRNAEKLGINEGVPKRVRLGGQAAGANLIFQPRPAYPPEARQQGIEGNILLDALIGRDGAVKDLARVSGNPVLAKAAIDAVNRWRYRPTKIRGEPVEVITQIQVNFTLEQPAF